MQAQTTETLLMVRPKHFGFNPETAESNSFQAQPSQDTAAIEALAQAEFDEMVEKLQLVGIEVLVYEDRADVHTPDSVFPNNWISLHKSGKVILYPMEAPTRRNERRQDIIADLSKTYDVDAILDLSYLEKEGIFLEGTGSIVLDRPHRTAYACLSSRTHQRALQLWQAQMNGYKLVLFHAFDGQNKPVYHTNVVMCIGDTFAVVCLQAITDFDERMNVRKNLESTGKHLVEISFEQMTSFAGNMLLVKNKNHAKYIVLSQRAYNSLNASQMRELESFASLLPVSIPTIETYGGGSARCMLCEVHLGKK